MRYVSFWREGGAASYGRLDGDRVIDLGGEAGGSLLEAIAAGLGETGSGDPVPLASITLLQLT